MTRSIGAWVTGLLLIAAGAFAEAAEDEECADYTIVCVGYECTQVGAGQCTFDNQAWNFNAIRQDQLIRGSCRIGEGSCEVSAYSCNSYKYSTSPLLPVCDDASFRCLEQAAAGYGCT